MHPSEFQPSGVIFLGRLILLSIYLSMVLREVIIAMTLRLRVDRKFRVLPDHSFEEFEPFFKYCTLLYGIPLIRLLLKDFSIMHQSGEKFIEKNDR